ncbi:MAG: IS110 family transposase [Alcanivoracaceae bacterium]|nr:IS110 family transposase [Alcanivoracaceae bacterium]
MKNSIVECVNQDLMLKKQVKLLITIDGIGEATAWSILAYLGDISLFSTSGQVTSFAGINPCIEDSGTSLKTSRLSKMGHKRLRKSLYMPAITAKKHNPVLIEFYDKLLNKGKPKKVAICAVMRKLLVIAYGVLKSEMAFDPLYKKPQTLD